MDSIVKQQAELAKYINDEYAKYNQSTDRSESYLMGISGAINAKWVKFEINNAALVDNFEELKSSSYFVNNLYERVQKEKEAFLARVMTRLEEARQVHAKTNGQSAAEEASTSNQITEASTLRKKFVKRIEFLQKNLSFALTGLENGTISLLQERIDDMKGEWKGLTEIYRNLLDVGQTADDETLYFNAKEEFEKTISMVKERMRVCNEVKLPTVNIQSFGGRDPKEWPNFYDLFRKTIHENVHLASIQKMQYLKTYTKDEAHKAIRHLTTSGENYEAAWEILHNKFHNERKIIDNYIKTIRDLARVNQNDARSLRTLHDTTKECVYGIANMGFDTDACSIFLNNLIIEKLDRDTQRRFEQQLTDPKRVPEFNELLRFIDEQADTMESIQEPQISNKQFNKKFNRNDNSNEKCFVCNKEHGSVTKCDMFMKLDPKDRLEKVKAAKVCRMCFAKHHTDSCVSKFTCKKCSSRHSSLIHVETKNKSIVANAAISELKQVFLATALMKCKASNGDYIVLRAMFDQGSQGTFITEEAAQLLKLKRIKINAEVDGFAETKSTKSTSMIKIEVESMTNANFKTNIETLVVKKITKPLPQEPVNIDSWEHLKNIELADPKFNIPAKVDISIGSDSFGEFVLSGLIRGESNTPYAQLTSLGWIVMGKSNQSTNHIVSCITNVQLEAQLKRFWEIESLNGENTSNSDDNNCEQFFINNHTRGEDGRYVIALPFNQNIKRLGKSRNMAMAQMFQLERKFRVNAAYKEKYVSCIREYMQLGHMVRVTKGEEEMATRIGQRIQYNTAYLPHHAVTKESSSTTKTRVVYDASRKTSSGISLNDAMWIGPNIQQDIFSILLRWRKYEIVFTADIQKMYRQIWVRDEDSEYQRIVWRESEDEPMCDYKLTTITFGTGPAPYLATRTVQQRAIEERENHPRAAEVILDDTYMDDSCSGTWDLDEAKQIQKQLRRMLKEAGFDLKKWASNNIEFLYAIDEEDREIQPAQFMDGSAIKILGLQWNNSGDHFFYTYEVEEEASQLAITKRQFLSSSAALFDPIGWLTPITVKLKMMFQKMWIDGTDWDENISVILQKEWNTFRAQANIINQIKINRWVNITANDQVIQLHGFCDASILAYGACIYVRIVHENGLITVHLLAAKSRIAPKNTKGESEVTLPKLELCGAVLLSQLFKKVTTALKMQSIKCFAWSDSMVAISWIRGQPSRWKTFVGNRTTEIRKHTEPEIWHYVPTDQNPADLASRGLFPNDLINNNLWWNGPKWLKMHEQNWPTQPNNFNTVFEMRIARLAHAAILENDFFERFSNWDKLLKCAATCLRFANNCRHEQKANEPISLPELRLATTRIIQNTQHRYFSDELEDLNRGRCVSTASKIANLCPFLDENGIMRVGGRLRNSALPYSQMHPIILSADAHISRLIIDNAHHTTMHGGENATLAAVRSKYWIIKAKSITKTYLRNCVRCAKVNTRSMSQMMADLPAPRVGISRPFTYCGVDYAGPFDIRTSKGRGHRSFKGYIALFICLATKAIHLETVSDLKATGFIAALKRLISRRGAPSHMYSDNGTNFCAGNKFIQAQDRLETKRINNEVMGFATKRNMEWHFNPPASPHFGGLWEAGVKSVKTHLRKLANTTFTFEEFSTILCQIEACLNSRPLCPMTNDPEDLRILTPAHFLIGDSIIAPTDHSAEENNLNLLTRWQLVQKMHINFWHHWSREYLTRLQQRPKWLRTRENLNVGDLVLICDNNIAPTKWPLGRIVKTIQGQDELVRVAEVKTMNGLVKRPIVKLCRLPNPSAVHENGKSSASQASANTIATEQPSTINEVSVDRTNTSDNTKTVKKSKRKMKKDNAAQQQINEKGKKSMRRKNVDESVKNTVKTRANRTRYNLRNFLTILIITFIGITAIGATENEEKKSFSIKKFDKQPGIYFEDIGKAKLINNEWHLVVYYRMNEYFQQAKLFGKHQRQMKVICEDMQRRGFTEEQDACQATLAQLEHQLDEIAMRNEIFSVSDSRSKRRRRGLINGIGMIASEAFGVLDYRFAERYEKDIKKSEADRDFILQLVKNQTSIFDATANLMKRSHEDINGQFSQLSKICTAIEETVNETNGAVAQQKRFERFAQMSLQQIILLEKYANLQNTLIDLITDTHQGHANPLLIPPAQLKEQITFIQAHLSDDLTLPGGAHKANLIELYTAMEIKTRTMKDHLIFDIRLPLISATDFQIYKLHSLPVTYNGSVWAIKPSTEYLLINMHRDLYDGISENEVKSCKSTQAYLQCHHHGVMYRPESHKHLCELNLLSHKKTMNGCELIRQGDGDQWIALNHPNEWIFSLSAEKTIDVICNGEPQQTLLNGQGILMLQEQCSIQIPELQMTAMSKITTHINRSYLPNINLTEYLGEKNFSHNHFLHWNATYNYTAEIEHLQQQMKQLPQLQTYEKFVKTNHSISGCLFFVIICFIGIWLFRVIKKVRTVQNTATNNVPTPAMRTINEPIYNPA